MLVGLNWSAVGSRLDAMGVNAEQRARIVELLGAIESGAMKAAADRRAESGED